LERELREKLGPRTYKIGYKVWLGNQVVSQGGKDVQLVEHFFYVPMPYRQFDGIGSNDKEDQAVMSCDGGVRNKCQNPATGSFRTI
jgi:hypothetical protein